MNPSSPAEEYIILEIYTYEGIVNWVGGPMPLEAAKIRMGEILYERLVTYRYEETQVSTLMKEFDVDVLKSDCISFIADRNIAWKFTLVKET